MNTNVHPLVIAAVVVVLVAGIGFWGYKASQPAPYVPSPGLSGAPGVTPGSVTADGGFGTVPKGAKPGSKIDVPGTSAPSTN